MCVCVCVCVCVCEYVSVSVCVCVRVLLILRSPYDRTLPYMYAHLHVRTYLLIFTVQVTVRDTITPHGSLPEVDGQVWAHLTLLTITTVRFQDSAYLKTLKLNRKEMNKWKKSLTLIIKCLCSSVLSCGVVLYAAVIDLNQEWSRRIIIPIFVNPNHR